LQAIFQSAQHLYEKREGSGSGTIPLTNGSGWPRNMRIRIPNTAFEAGAVSFWTYNVYILRLFFNLLLIIGTRYLH
jgi:hypothetical protein